jgi:hypothetical protein
MGATMKYLKMMMSVSLLVPLIALASDESSEATEGGFEADGISSDAYVDAPELDGGAAVIGLGLALAALALFRESKRD